MALSVFIQARADLDLGIRSGSAADRIFANVDFPPRAVNLAKEKNYA